MLHQVFFVVANFSRIDAQEQVGVRVRNRTEPKHCLSVERPSGDSG